MSRFFDPQFVVNSMAVTTFVAEMVSNASRELGAYTDQSTGDTEEGIHDTHAGGLQTLHIRWDMADQKLLNHPSMALSVQGILVDKRLGKRRLRRFCQGRKSWTTYRKISGGGKYLQN